MISKRVITSSVFGLGAILFIDPGVSAQDKVAQDVTGCVSSDATCPPNGYPYEDDMGNTVKMPQPPLDTDTDGDGVNDAWGGSVTVTDDSGDKFESTDECGNTICLVCIPDPAGAGCGADYFSPRIKKNGAWPGTTVGKCHYTYGNNTWKLEFRDADGDDKPDKFTKSTWRSCDGGSSDPASDCYSPTAGEWTTYVWDEKTGKVVVSHTKPGEITGTENDFIEQEIEDSIIICEVPEDNSIGLSMGVRDKQHLVFGPDSAAQRMIDVAVTHVLDAQTSRAVMGEEVLATGVVTNHDSVAHTYSLRLDDVGLDELEVSASELVVASGESASYTVSGMVREPGDVALVVMALCLGTSEEEVAANTYLTAATFSPRGPTMTDFGGALSGTLGEPLLAGYGEPLDGEVLSLELSSAQPNSTAWLLVSDGLGSVPFAGGTLQAMPALAIASLTTDVSGNLGVQLRSPGLEPGQSLGFQYVIQDAGAVQGFAFSNAIESALD